MRIFIKIISIIAIISCFVLGVYLGIVIKTMWGFLLMAPAFTALLSISISFDDHYWAYNKRDDSLLNELETEKQAYIDARKDLEATSLLLGNILIDKKEKY